MVSLCCYPKADRTKYYRKTFANERLADSWLIKHNAELLCFVPDYWTYTVSIAEEHSGERLESEQLSLF